MIDLVVGFVIEMLEEAWYAVKVLAHALTYYGLAFVLPLALAWCANAWIESMRPGTQPFWRTAAIVVGLFAWWVWSRRVARSLENRFGEG